jgi:hypothetical protein
MSVKVYWGMVKNRGVEAGQGFYLWDVREWILWDVREWIWYVSKDNNKTTTVASQLTTIWKEAGLIYTIYNNKDPEQQLYMYPHDEADIKYKDKGNI